MAKAKKEKLFSLRKLAKFLWISLAVGIVIVALLFVYIAKTKMPDTQELEQPRVEYATIVYSADGKELDRYFSINREPLRFEELSPHLVHALIATEDHRYYQHSGIDSYGLARAIAFMGSRGGASTISQQLAKQFFTAERSSNKLKRVWQKLKEWVIAVEFERRYTKEEVLAMLLNKFDFIYGANGVAAAAKVYFGKDQKNLNVREAAMLIGMLKNPYYYNPHIYPEHATQRRKTVLAQMHKHDYITDETYAEERSLELDMSRFRRTKSYSGLAPHFMAELKKYVRQLLSEKNITKPGGEKYNLDIDGLKIYTTIDTRYQRHAEAAMKEHMSALQRSFERAWEHGDPWEYKGNDNQNIAPRTAELNQQIEASERYAGLRKKYLSPIITRITREIEGARLLNEDIQRMFRAKRNPDYFSQMIADGYMTAAQRQRYKTIMASPHWPALQNAWRKLTQAVRKDFNTRRSMVVYSHEGPVRKMMTPIDSIKYMLNMLQIGSVAMDPKTGYVKSWIGGIDYTHWKYDHVNANRQVGSTFKPFVYTAGVMNGISPCWKIKDVQYTIPANDPGFNISKSWSPQNARSKFSEEEVTLMEALKRSLNSASVWLLQQLGSVNPIIELAEKMGIAEDKIPRYPSIVLGAAQLSVLEMTTAYSTFANNGITTKPVFVERIEDQNGRTIYTAEISSHRSIPENYNSVMVEMLKYAAGAVSWRLETDFGGKTGTTNDHVDAWFMGISPNLVVGTWVGGEYPWIRFVDFSMGQGSRMARPYYINYMKRIENDPKIGFDKQAVFAFPSNLNIELDCSKYEKLRTDEEESIEEFDEDMF